MVHQQICQQIPSRPGRVQLTLGPCMTPRRGTVTSASPSCAQVSYSRQPQGHTLEAALSSTGRRLIRKLLRPQPEGWRSVEEVARAESEVRRLREELGERRFRPCHRRDRSAAISAGIAQKTCPQECRRASSSRPPYLGYLSPMESTWARHRLSQVAHLTPHIPDGDLNSHRPSGQLLDGGGP